MLLTWCCCKHFAPKLLGLIIILFLIQCFFHVLSLSHACLQRIFAWFAREKRPLVCSIWKLWLLDVFLFIVFVLARNLQSGFIILSKTLSNRSTVYRTEAQVFLSAFDPSVWKYPSVHGRYLFTPISISFVGVRTVFCSGNDFQFGNFPCRVRQVPVGLLGHECRDKNVGIFSLCGIGVVQSCGHLHNHFESHFPRMSTRSGSNSRTVSLNSHLLERNPRVDQNVESTRSL